MPTVAASHQSVIPAGERSGQDDAQSRTTFWALTIGSIGVVYGDIGTSPLYAFREAAVAASAGGTLSRQAVLGVLSLILWALIVVVTLKYVLILLRADNKGEGGTLALMALAQRALRKTGGVVVLCGIISAALFYGDAMITPALSVLSAIEGLKIATPAFEPYIVPLTLVILVALFAVQSRGTAKVAAFFGPITALWFIAIAIPGIAFIGRNPEVLLAFKSDLCRRVPDLAWHDRAHHARRGVPRRDRSGGALRRSRSFRQEADPGRLGRPGAALACGETISARGRWCLPIPRRSRTRSSCSIPTGCCSRWWCWRPPRR